MVEFATTDEEFEIIHQVIDRAESDHPGRTYDRMTHFMDLAATNANGCPIDFVGLLNASTFTFAHDFFGISRHLDRETGQLMDCFRPRTAK